MATENLLNGRNAPLEGHRKRRSPSTSRGRTKNLDRVADHANLNGERTVNTHAGESIGGIRQYMDLDNLDMLRSLLCLWILLFHSLCFIASHMTDAEGHRISMGVAYGGYVAVDGFLVLTGFLVSMPYVSRNSRLSMTGKSLPERAKFIVDQYFKRFTRIVPPLAVALLLHCCVVFPSGTQEIERQRQLSGQVVLRRLLDVQTPLMSGKLGNGCENSWGALLFVNNLQAFGGTLMHLWSLAVQYQFYLQLPILHAVYDLSRGKRFLYVTLAITSFGLICRAASLLYFHSFPVNSLVQSLMNFNVYSFTFNRLHSIWIGGLAAWTIDRYPGALRQLQKKSLTSAVVHLLLIVLSSLYVYWSCFISGIGVPRSVSYNALLHVGSVGSALVWCYVICWTSSKRQFIPWVSEGISSNMGLIVKHGIWKKLAKLSYLIFLIHPTVFIRLYSDPSLLMPPSKQDIPTPVIILRKGVSTVSTVTRAMQEGSRNSTVGSFGTDAEPHVAQLKQGFPASATAFLDDDEHEWLQDQSIANNMRSTWKMIERLEQPAHYEGPTIPGTSGMSSGQFLMYSWIALLVVIFASEILETFVVDPLTNLLLQSKGIKSGMWYVVAAHSVICIAASVVWHVGWLWTVLNLPGDLESDSPVGQFLEPAAW
eukprot:gb/GECG01004148.1/.p1 GENE.gb/GECG01004148.1/~~gb/GECG01004148.1/.p1  ORF type:complete len:652 (+),score=45.42 gb/GECG01004148.1/:1-1956(+)